MDYGCGLRSLSPPVAPLGAGRRGGGKHVGRSELWKNYYGEYARYSQRCKESLDVWRTFASGVRDVGAVDRPQAQVLLGCGGDTGWRSAGVVGDIERVGTGQREVGSGGPVAPGGLVELVKDESHAATVDGLTAERVPVVGTGAGLCCSGASAVGGCDCGVQRQCVEVCDGVLQDGGVESRLGGDQKYVPPQLRGVESGGAEGAGACGRGKHYASNKAARERRKRARQSGPSAVVDESSRVESFGAFSACSKEQRDSLQQSRAVRLMAENRLKAAEADRRYELLQAQDVAQLKRRQETRLMRDTELNKVQVEQAFGKLAGTGNVPGFAQTVVSSEGTPQLVSGSISPNSSVSMAEVHAMQKENLEYRRRLDLLQKRNPELALEVMGAKLPSERSGWTIGEDGVANCGDGFGVGGIMGADGRLHDYEDYADY